MVTTKKGVKEIRNEISKAKMLEKSKENNEPEVAEDVILKNLQKINESTKRLEEIEKKLNNDISECEKFINFYDKSKSLLDSKDFTSDVGREDEIKEIRNIIKKCSTNYTSEGIFLTGPSGQGKTYSIFYILNEIENEKENQKKKKRKEKSDVTENYKNIDPSHYYVSCSNCEKPYDIFVDILQQIIKKDKKLILSDIKQKYHLNGLDEVKKAFINYTSKLTNLKIVIVDELDFIAVKNARIELRTKAQNKNTSEDIVKNLFECVCHDKCKIILVGIANSFDLLKDYTHIKINQIIYKPYTEKQFMNIIKHKLNSLEDELIQKIFKGVSLNIHVRQISNRSGDIRSCFDAILRVFSEKRSELNDRKNILYKLKEEIMVNKVFNQQEKKNLTILAHKKKLNEQVDGMKIEAQDACEKKNLVIATTTNNNNNNKSPNDVSTKRKNSQEDRNILSKETNKRLKIENENDSGADTECTNATTNTTTTTTKNNDVNSLTKELSKVKNEKETLSDILNIKQHGKYDMEKNDFDFESNFDNNFSLNYSETDFMKNYESPFKILYKNTSKSEESDTDFGCTTTNTTNNRSKFKKPPMDEVENLLNSLNVEKFVSSFEGIVEDQVKILEHKYETVKTEVSSNAVMISDIKKITDKIPLEEHKDILFKIKSLPLIQKIYLYASCNVINNEHLNSDEEENEENEETSKNRNIEITYADIQRSYRVLCSQLSETSHIRDILEGSTVDQAIEHFEELGILTNLKKGKEKISKTTKGLSPRFATKKNTKNFSSQNKMNSVYNFNLPVKVIKQTLKEISSILSTFDGTG